MIKVHTCDECHAVLQDETEMVSYRRQATIEKCIKSMPGELHNLNKTTQGGGEDCDVCGTKISKYDYVYLYALRSRKDGSFVLNYASIVNP